MYCTHCGTPFADDDANFCNRCGAPRRSSARPQQESHFGVQTSDRTAVDAPQRTSVLEIRNAPKLNRSGDLQQPTMVMRAQADPAPPGTSRVLYIAYASPVPFRLGPARRHYHVLEQLARFYDVHFLCLGDRSEAEAFERHFGDRVPGFTFVPRSASRGRRHVQKVAQTLMGRCDFLPALEPGLRQACARVTAAQEFDAIVLSSVLLRSLPLPEGVPLVADTHNVEFDVLRRTAAHADRLLLRGYARRQWPATLREE